MNIRTAWETIDKICYNKEGIVTKFPSQKDYKEAIFVIEHFIMTHCSAPDTVPTVFDSEDSK